MNNQHADYYAQDLGSVWSHKEYRKYLGSEWPWFCLPFDDDFSVPRPYMNRTQSTPVRGASILEIGSAMGQAYNVLKSSAIVDVSDYTGIEVSDLGHRTSRERFPETTWIHADYTRYALSRRYDYAFERIAIHHMPDPVEQIRKTLRHVNVSFNTTFVGCVEPGTISDLKLGYYNNDGQGLAYFDIISVPEVIAAARAEGFNHIRVIYLGKHPPIPSNPKGHQYLAPEVSARKTIGHFIVRASRIDRQGAPLVYLVNGGRFGGVNRWVSEPQTVLRLRKVVAQARR
jgi:hypothetical protein